RAAAPFARFRRAVHRWCFAVFHDQTARGDEAGDLGVAKFLEQSEYVPVNWLLPNALTRAEIAAHQRGVNPRIQRRAVKCNQPAFTVAGDADAPEGLGLLSRQRDILFDKPIDRSRHFLRLVANDVPAHFVRLAIDPFAMRLIGEAAEPGVA